MKNIISIADNIFAANTKNTAVNGFSVQKLSRACSYIAELLTASEARRGELEFLGLADVTQEIFNGDDLEHEQAMAKLVIQLLDGYHIVENQGPLFDVINEYVQDQLFTNNVRVYNYNCIFMSALVNAIRIKNKIKFYTNRSINSVFQNACDIVAEDGMHKIEMSELLFSGKAHGIMNMSYNFPKLVEGIQNAYIGATMEQLCNPHVDGVTKKAFEHYICTFDKTVKMAIASAVEDGPSCTRDKLFFQLYLDEVIDMLKLLLGK